MGDTQLEIRHKDLRKQAMRLKKELDDKSATLSINQAQLHSVKENGKKIQLEIEKCEQQTLRIVRLLEEKGKNQSFEEMVKLRELNEAEMKLQDKLQELAQKREPLLPSAAKEPLEPETLIINSIIIVYHQADGTRFKVALRIDKNHKLSEILTFCKKHWDITGHEYVLCSSNFGILFQGEEPLYKLIEESRSEALFHFLPKNKISALIPEDYNPDPNKELPESTVMHHEVSAELKSKYYKQFRKEYKRLSTYMPEHPDISEDKELKRIKRWDYRISTCCINLLLIVFTMLAYSRLVNTEQVFWITYQFRADLNVETAAGFSYSSMISFNDVETFLTGPLADFFYGSTSTLTANHAAPVDEYTKVGPLRFRMLRTEVVDCHNELFDLEATCYKDEYSESTREEATIGDGSQQ